MRRGTGIALLGSLLFGGGAPARQVTQDADQAQMMRRLGIVALRPGVDADPSSPRHANEDEAQANPYPDLPDPLRFADGRAVSAADWPRRRAEIAALYAREVYGEVPADVPPVRWQVEATDRETIGFGRPVVARRVIGHVDDAGTGIAVALRMVVVMPADAKGPVPVLVMFGRDAFPAPSQPDAAEIDRINAALRAELAVRDPSLARVFAAHQAFPLVSAAPFRFPDRDRDGNLPPAEQLVAAGWGYAILDPASAQEDGAAGLSRGIVGLADRGAPRRPEQWGALRAWAWAASRAYDWLSAQPEVDRRRVGIEGVSRYGKAALVTMAFDPRFAIGLIGSSGKGGTTPLRRDFGEGVGNLATGEGYWMAGNFIRYDTKGVSPPNLDAGDLPVDANELIALAAPRPLFISYGVPAAGDATWLDQRGSWMATVDASRVYRLLGDSGVDGGAAGGVAGRPYPALPMPPVGRLTGGTLAWRQHDGGHTDTPNMASFLTWAARVLPGG